MMQKKDTSRKTYVAYFQRVAVGGFPDPDVIGFPDPETVSVAGLRQRSKLGRILTIAPRIIKITPLTTEPMISPMVPSEVDAGASVDPLDPVVDP